jgi:hypothetical protein
MYIWLLCLLKSARIRARNTRLSECTIRISPHSSCCCIAWNESSRFGRGITHAYNMRLASVTSHLGASCGACDQRAGGDATAGAASQLVFTEPAVSVSVVIVKENTIYFAFRPSYFSCIWELDIALALYVNAMILSQYFSSTSLSSVFRRENIWTKHKKIANKERNLYSSFIQVLLVFLSY